LFSNWGFVQQTNLILNSIIHPGFITSQIGVSEIITENKHWEFVFIYSTGLPWCILVYFNLDANIGSFHVTALLQLT